MSDDNLLLAGVRRQSPQAPKRGARLALDSRIALQWRFPPPARAGETVHTSSSRRAGRLIPARAGRYLALGCFFGVVPAHPRAGGALLRAHRALPGAASRIGVGQSALGQVISLPQ